MAKVEKVNCQPAKSGAVPVGWGFTFLDRRGERPFSIYTDRSGREAMVNGYRMHLDLDDLFQWAEAASKGCSDEHRACPMV